ncbi:Cofilin/tropomyosin-type actin-binding protein [Trichomonas vaginalis G3]|uniref:Cofilin/tropomyosin-type actin-binding protein n=1 Tax=Trichomonas vaginalis (strain ATCC PRA-98 / G3) TaxID=412133 RepID=A2FM06_TRIV3|nr:actin binding [Trichomonas vaginalis G3]EAX94047.1 Cofilin/tropomyosin-type actin-binding protein [Trichomonas vaginalis G3]KAI5548223.1 actin binding [Trichomonas vaginalis G3]|eukprot:XP_001306977.1 Cofilin/tropomyosin-type actin-binding protein [Trichomonas vaginalis G3]
MSDCSDPAIREAYEEVRKDVVDTNWLLITYAEGSDKVWTLVGKGNGGLDELKEHLNENFRGFGYLRCTTGDELSVRSKFVFITFCGGKVRLIHRTKLTVHKADVLRVIEQVSISVDASSTEELTQDDINARLNKAGGAHYN